MAVVVADRLPVYGHAAVAVGLVVLAVLGVAFVVGVWRSAHPRVARRRRRSR